MKYTKLYRLLFVFTLGVFVLDSTQMGSAKVLLQTLNFKNFLPVISRTAGSTQRTVNLPNFGNDEIRFEEMAIFWFGRITPQENYTDVRMGYNNQEISVILSIFDRLLWYDETPSSADLTNWDAVSLYISADTQDKAGLSQYEYRFIGQLNDWQPNRSPWQSVSQGSAAGWKSITAPFTTFTGIRWEVTGGGVNNNKNNRGWVMQFGIPFTSLGPKSPPKSGDSWRFAIILHDRDDSAGTTISQKKYPENMEPSDPSTWGVLHFGLSNYQKPTAPPAGTTQIQNKLNGATVIDAAMGGTTGNLCNGDVNYIWTQWGNENYGSSADFNIQNQSDIADWPCFAKYYVTFPINQVPAGKIILSATLTLHHWGNSGPLTGPGAGQRSYIHVFTVSEDWQENQITWNNAPLAFENIGQRWVDMAPASTTWPGIPITWDVTKAVAEAYFRNAPVRLALYSSDSAYSSGKFFLSSNAEDWVAVGRPKLTISWGNP